LYELALDHFLDVDVSDQAGAKATFIAKMNELRDADDDPQANIVFKYLVCALRGYRGNASYQCVDQGGNALAPNYVWSNLQDTINSPAATFSRQGVAYLINTGYLDGDVYWFACGGDWHCESPEAITLYYNGQDVFTIKINCSNPIAGSYEQESGFPDEFQPYAVSDAQVNGAYIGDGADLADRVTARAAQTLADANADTGDDAYWISGTSVVICTRVYGPYQTHLGQDLAVIQNAPGEVSNPREGTNGTRGRFIRVTRNTT
jgi:hypothetical protein